MNRTFRKLSVAAFSIIIGATGCGKGGDPIAPWTVKSAATLACPAQPTQSTLPPLTSAQKVRVQSLLNGVADVVSAAQLVNYDTLPWKLNSSGDDVTRPAVRQMWTLLMNQRKSGACEVNLLDYSFHNLAGGQCGILLQGGGLDPDEYVVTSNGMKLNNASFSLVVQSAAAKSLTPIRSVSTSAKYQNSTSNDGSTLIEITSMNGEALLSDGHTISAVTTGLSCEQNRNGVQIASWGGQTLLMDFGDFRAQFLLLEDSEKKQPVYGVNSESVSENDFNNALHGDDDQNQNGLYLTDILL